jgi:hypothetical protein
MESSETPPPQKNEEIAYCKIFPPIGIARVGDSELTKLNEGWFIDPAVEDLRSAEFSYKDNDGKIKRQAAMFKVYAFGHDDLPLRELTSDEASLVWRVHLANKKAAWFNFSGTEKALNAFTGKSTDIPAFRNRQVGTISLVDGKYVPSQERIDNLEIDGGVLEISGRSIESDHQFVGKFKRAVDVYLGEIKTDVQGRLIVLGGYGNSDAVDDQGQSVKEDRWIRNYANNDDWHDDISDGPVSVKVSLNSDNSELEVRGGAWVLVAPPDFAPDVKNIVTLYDVMEETAFRSPALQNPTTPEIRKPDAVSFELDIKPALERMHSQRWVNARGLRGHGTHKSGDFQDKNGNDPTILKPDLSDKQSETGNQSRRRILSVLRRPAYRIFANGDFVDNYDSTEAITQAKTTFMPPLAGDEGDPEDGKPASWLSLTYLQYQRFVEWNNKNFTVGNAAPPPSLMLELNALTRRVLENCAGGAFYPGIEMTCVARDPRLYEEAFRISHAKVGAGDISKFMAVPWQADFWECQQHWWPAQRPDDVITNEELEGVLNKFTSEIDGNYEKVLFERTRWDRGIGIKSRPSNKYLFNRILPEPVVGTSVDDYILLLSGRLEKPANLKFDSLYYLFDRLSGIGGFTDFGPDYRGDGSDLTSPWRVQYLVQERLDSYSGLYFHLVVTAPEETKNLVPEGSNQTTEELRRNWSVFRFEEPVIAATILGKYATQVDADLKSQISVILTDLKKALEGESAESVKLDEFREFLKGVLSDVEDEFAFRDFDSHSTEFHKLRAVEMIESAVDFLYLFASTWVGDMDMVNQWKLMGFVVKRTVNFGDADKGAKANTLQIEEERSKFDGKSFRDYFYYLMNIQDHPDFIPQAKLIAEDILSTAQEVIDNLEIFDSSHPESFIEYSEAAFDAKLEEIYEILRSQAATALGWRTSRNRAAVIQRIRDNAVFNQADGAWLRFIANTGSMDKVASLLFEVWSDEIGNGDPALHHGNLYTNLLGSLGVVLPPVNSRAYADHPDLDESTFISPVFELAISQHSEAFFPELIGMTLFLEWEVLSLVPYIKGLEYLGVDSHFWKMHVGIDNATQGHGAKAKEAARLYLDDVLKESGVDAVRNEWRRIWRGFVAFAIAGYGYFSNRDSLESQRADSDLAAKHQGNPQDEIVSLMTRKAHYGSLNHTGKNVGGHRINDLFEEPAMFAHTLAASPYVIPGQPDDSKLLNYLTTFEGPMYKVFDAKDLTLWRKWIVWLGKEGDTDSNKKFLTKARSMFLLMQDLRELASSTDGHKRYKLDPVLKKKSKDRSEKKLIAEFFSSGDIEGLMRALRDPENGWVVPFDPGSSAMVLDLARADHPMGAALDRRFPRLGNQIGRIVLIKWIEAGCPIPGEPPPPEPKSLPTRLWKGKQLLVQQVGMGAVH